MEQELPTTLGAGGGWRSLSPREVFRPADLRDLAFATTNDLQPLDAILGSARAVDAIDRALDIQRKGFNAFVLGPPGTGKRTVVLEAMQRVAKNGAAPPDWVYVHNFSEPHRPRALKLPTGRGAQLRDDMKQLIDELRVAIPTAFESDDYRTRRGAIDEEIKRRRDAKFSVIEKQAAAKKIAIIRTPVGLGLAPTHDGEVIAKDVFDRLPEEERKRIHQEMAALQEALNEFFRQMPQWESDRYEKIRALNRDVVKHAVGHLIAAVVARHEGQEHVVAHLKVVEADLLENAQQFVAEAQQAAGDESPLGALMRRGMSEGRIFERYQVNLVVDCRDMTCAPVNEEDHPTLQNLVGKVEFRSQFGALVTDFTMIKAGSLHRANGGYLLLDARRVISQPFAWEELKRALRAGEIRIQSVPEMLGLVSAGSLLPDPIPLDVKIVLTGDRWIHQLLAALDPDFAELFKIAADFDDDIVRTAEVEGRFARQIAAMVRREKLRALERGGVERIIEFAARLAEDSERLSNDLETIGDVLREADYLAGRADSATIARAHVAEAIETRRIRANRIPERVQDAIARGTLKISTQGARVGQINGLTVARIADASFGWPVRISARVRLGKGEVIDIEREVELGGPIHSKGVMILTAFLGERFGRGRPISLSASLVFEQSYGGVEGDSASIAELCAVLSAIAGIGLRQDLAVTGSVNQHGEAQAIGGVNEKIEGFFEVCARAGLTGTQGVIIPASNIKHLMLREAVVSAVEQGRFQVHAIETIDDALTLLSGIPAGVADQDGKFPEGSANRKVDDQLAAFAEQARRFVAGGREGSA
jgi:lon-related putative ATP-dependent protease